MTKPATELLPPRALLAASAVLGDGSAHQGRGRDWEAGRPMSGDYAALLRHLLRWQAGEDLDASGHSHLAHVAARALILLDLELRGLPGSDDRPAAMDRNRPRATASTAASD